MEDEDQQVVEWLKPVFPQLSQSVLKTSVLHPSNRRGEFDRARLLQRCIDDLLELRTHRLSTGDEDSFEGDRNARLRVESVNDDSVVHDSFEVSVTGYAPGNSINLTGDDDLTGIMLELENDLTADESVNSSRRSSVEIVRSVPQTSSARVGTNSLVNKDAAENVLSPRSLFANQTPAAPGEVIVVEVAVKTEEELLQEHVKEVCDIFPEIQPKYVQGYLNSCKKPNRVAVMIEFLFERKGLYPKRKDTDGQKSRRRERRTKSKITSHGLVSVGDISLNDSESVQVEPKTSGIARELDNLDQVNYIENVIDQIVDDVDVLPSFSRPNKCIYVEEHVTIKSNDINESVLELSANNITSDDHDLMEIDQLIEEPTVSFHKVISPTLVTEAPLISLLKFPNKVASDENGHLVQEKSAEKSSTTTGNSVPAKVQFGPSTSTSDVPQSIKTNSISISEIGKINVQSSTSTFNLVVTPAIKTTNAIADSGKIKDQSKASATATSNSVPAKVQLGPSTSSVVPPANKTANSIAEIGIINDQNKASSTATSNLVPAKVQLGPSTSGVVPPAIKTTNFIAERGIINDQNKASSTATSNSVPANVNNQADPGNKTNVVNKDIAPCTITSTGDVNKVKDINKKTVKTDNNVGTKNVVPTNIAKKVLPANIATNNVNNIVPVANIGTNNVINIVPVANIGTNNVNKNVPVANIGTNNVNNIVPVANIGTNNVNNIVPAANIGTKNVNNMVPVAKIGTNNVNNMVPVAKIGTNNVNNIVPAANIGTNNVINIAPAYTGENNIPRELGTNSLDQEALLLEHYKAMANRLSATMLSGNPAAVADLTVAAAPPPVVRSISPEIPVIKTQEQLMAEEVCGMFPDILPSYIEEQLKSCQAGDKLNYLVNLILEDPKACPKKEKVVISDSTTSPVENTDGIMETNNNWDKTDYYKEFSSQVSSDYTMECLKLLELEFLKLPKKDLRYIMSKFNNHYAPSRHCMIEAFRAKGIKTEEVFSPLVGSVGGKTSSPVVPASDTTNVDLHIQVNGDTLVYRSKLLKCGRQKRTMCQKLCPELKKEVDFIVGKTKNEKEEQDHLLAMTVNENEYEEAGQLIECGCCFGEYPFESMVQCYEGHLFCRECLNCYAKEAVFGGGKVTLQCMTDECESTYPKSQLQKSLPTTVLAKYEDRCQEESINLADMEGLVRCPHCDFAALMDPGDKVFSCHKCKKETCRYCKESWEEHFGIPCAEIEKKDETKHRLEYEEKMTMAKVRKCHRCKASFTKSDGCNKMTCRCGAKMCYICREPNINYDHFCRHVRDPGKDCETCKACSLWTNPEEDDDRAVNEIKKEAQESRKAQGFEGDKAIGAPEDEPKAKKRKVETVVRPQQQQQQNRAQPAPAQQQQRPNQQQQNRQQQQNNRAQQPRGPQPVPNNHNNRNQHIQPQHIHPQHIQPLLNIQPGLPLNPPLQPEHVMYARPPHMMQIGGLQPMFHPYQPNPGMNPDGHF